MSAGRNSLTKRFLSVYWRRWRLGVVIAAAVLLSVETKAQPSNEEKLLLINAQVVFRDFQYARVLRMLDDFLVRFENSKLRADVELWRSWAQAELQVEARDLEQAARILADVIRDYPESVDVFEISLREAEIRMRTAQYRRVIALMTDPANPFLTALRDRPSDTKVTLNADRAYLLLAEAYLGSKVYEEAEQVLDQFKGRVLRSPELYRQLFFLRTRLYVETERFGLALTSAESLLSSSLGRPEWLGEAVLFRADVLQANQQYDAAMGSLNLIITNQVFQTNRLMLPRRRQAMLKLIDLELSQNRTDEAIGRLESWIERPEDFAIDVALLTLGELKLQGYFEQVEAERLSGVTPSTAKTHLVASLVALDRVVREFGDSEYKGKAQFYRGWCFWESDQIAESQDAFQEAVKALSFSREKAEAYFKLADCQYQLEDYAGAVGNYQKVTSEFKDLPEVRDTLLDQALYQTVRAAIEANDLGAAGSAAEMILALYPDSFFADRGNLLVGQKFSRVGSVSKARGIFNLMVERFSDQEFPLRAEVDLAIAYSYELEGNWRTALTKYETWLEDYPNHQSQARVEFARAWMIDRNGDREGARTEFEGFIDRFADSSYAPWAQNWIGDYHFNRRDYSQAQSTYDKVIDTMTNATAGLALTNANSTLFLQARLMAAKSAYWQKNYTNAIAYLGPIYKEFREDKIERNDEELAAEATLLLADCYLEDGLANPTNRDGISLAREAFSQVFVEVTTHRLAAIAWARYGDTYLLLGDDYEIALDAYQQVLEHSEADIALRSRARVALGEVYEHQSNLPDAERSKLLTDACDQFLKVFYRENLKPGEQADPFWIEESGLRALRIIEEQERWKVAIKLYDRLIQVLPPLKDQWIERRAQAEAKLKSEG